MSGPVDFYFDFSSPYGYFASTTIDRIAAESGRDVDWHPILLGAVFKIVGTAPLVDYPLKGNYMRRDLLRAARLWKITFKEPPGFPHNTIAAARLYYWIHDEDTNKAKAFARAVYAGFFEQGRDVSSAEAATAFAVEQGFDRGAAIAALANQAVKDRLRGEVDAAIARGVFGSPFVIVDGEPFWGSDRLDQVKAWLETGGW